MCENIELQTFHKNQHRTCDSEEYHEISNEALEETLFSPKRPVTPVKDYDFFTQHDTGLTRKQIKKKKTKKKDRKSKSLIDVISSELASKPVLIRNNIVRVDPTERERYLEKNLRKPQMPRLKVFRNLDAESGINGRKIDRISPIFPRVLEHTVSKEISFSVQYKEPSLFSEVVTEYLESSIKQTPKFLDIILKNIKFNHHHEFSLETLCSLKLLECYKIHQSTMDSLKDIIKNIDINRQTRTNLKEKLIKISPNRKDEIRYDKNILKYTKTLLELKEKYYKMLQEQKNNVHQIMSLWADIEMIREKSGLTKTHYLLQIATTELDNSDFEKQWKECFEKEYSDMIVKIEYDYVNKYLEYKELKRIDTSNHKNKIVKPKLDIDYDILKVKVEALVNFIVSRSNIDLLLVKDRNLLSDASHEIISTFVNDYVFKIYVDDIFVCESDQYKCQEDQNYIDFIEYLSIEILPNNKIISIILLENNDEVSSFKIHLSDIKKNTIETSTIHNFVFNKTMEPSVKFIGSGYDIKEIAKRNKVRLKSSNMFRGKLWTRCDTNILLSWNDKFNENQYQSIKSCMEVGRQLKQILLGKTKPSLNEITEIINYLYNNNVQDNANIVIALTDICKTKVNIENDFILHENNSQLTRFKLLNLRNCGGFLDIESKTVPMFASQMSTELLGCLQENEMKVLGCNDFKIETENNSIDIQRFVGTKFVEKLNLNLMKKINDLLLKVTYKDVVRDFEDVSIRSLFSNQSSLSLDAVNSISKQQLIKESLIKEQEIYVTIFKAFNLAERSTALITEENSVDNIAGFNVHPLRPFVQVSYRGVTAQTTTAIGRHPTWNHTLKIKTRLTPLSTLHINIYDQCKENLNETNSDDQSQQTTVIYRKCNKWLGSIHIPLHTVLSLGNIRGTLKLNVPPLIFGYENSAPKQTDTTFPEINQFMKKDMSYLTLQITTSMAHLGGFLSYRQPVSNDPNDDFIIRHLNEFVTEYTSDFPTRNISLTFIDSTGRNKCICEYLQAIPLPEYEYFPKDPKKTESAQSKSSGHSKSSSSKSSRKKSLTDDKGSVSADIWNSGESQTIKYIDAVLRYVSLIPTYEATDTHVVTLMGVELLKVLYGSPLDHTILLAGYFLHLDIKCWIIVGFAFPRGLSSYVLVQHYHDKIIRRNDQIRSRGICGGVEGFTWYIYDAVAGEKYELREIGCPLKTVCYVFDSENIWVNIQNSQDCESVSFNFSKSSDWKTVFSKPFFIIRPISCSLYSKPEDVEGLRSNLETKIKNKIQKWRSHVKTIWNRYCSNLLREMLPQWEYWAFNPGEARTSPGHRWKQFMATYKVYGFPLNMPYVSQKLVVSQIKATAVHASAEPRAEFALAVEVFAYPNNVLSVWVFLASIVRI